MMESESARPLSVAEVRQIEQTCDRFEAVCKLGQRPDLYEYLTTVAAPVRSASAAAIVP